MKAARRDANEAVIVDALRKVGATVVRVTTSSTIGAPDLFVAYVGRWFALEVKQSKTGRLSLEQQVLAGRAPISVVTTVDEALMAIGAVRPGPRG